jgi:hypothetical protein
MTGVNKQVSGKTSFYQRQLQYAHGLRMHNRFQAHIQGQSEAPCNSSITIK